MCFGVVPPMFDRFLARLQLKYYLVWFFEANVALIGGVLQRAYSIESKSQAGGRGLFGHD